MDVEQFGKLRRQYKRMRSNFYDNSTSAEGLIKRALRAEAQLAAAEAERDALRALLAAILDAAFIPAHREGEIVLHAYRQEVSDALWAAYRAQRESR